MNTNPIINFFDGNFPLTITIYCLLLAGVVVITTLLSRLCVILKEKAHLSDGIVAGLLLGVITSLPELVTCITSVLVHKTGSLGFGDIVGSNIFDMFVLAVCLIICVKMFVNHQANQINTMTLVFTGVGTIFILFAILIEQYFPILVFNGFNLFSLFVLMSYIASIFFLTRDPRAKTINSSDAIEVKQAKESKLYFLDLKWVITLIVIAALVLIACAIFLTYTAESLIFYHWSGVFGTEEKASFGGALLLGIVTSLPEIVCCINLCVGKEYNMVINTIVGSTTFNLSILTIANIVFACIYDPSNPQTMYGFNEHNLTQVVVSLVMVALLIVYLVLNSAKFKDKFSDKQSIAVNSTLLSVTISCYIVFIILGFLW